MQNSQSAIKLIYPVSKIYVYEMYPAPILIQCRHPNVVKHRKRHITHVAFSALNHFHVDAKRVWKLSRQECIALLETIDQYLERGDHGGPISCDDFLFGREFCLGHCSLRSTYWALDGAIELIQQPRSCCNPEIPGSVRDMALSSRAVAAGLSRSGEILANIGVPKGYQTTTSPTG